jgi:DNA-binding MarR family transcriptional regulator
MDNVSLIEIFENHSIQNVDTFNSIFKKTPIVGFDPNTEVEIKDLHKGDERKIRVGDQVIFLKIIQLKRKPRTRKKTTDLGILKKVSAIEKKQLPDIFLKLSPSEFMVHQAIALLGCIDGIEELSKQISLTGKTISPIIKKLTEMGLVHTERVSADGKPLLRLHLTH